MESHWAVNKKKCYKFRFFPKSHINLLVDIARSLYRALNLKTIILLINDHGHTFFPDHIDSHHSMLKHRKWIGCSPTWLTLRAVAANPAWVALAGSVDGVAGAIVGTGANACTVFPKSATGTHCEQTQVQSTSVRAHLTEPRTRETNSRATPSGPLPACLHLREHIP